MLEARHLVKRFFRTAVVSDVSFEVRAGEVSATLVRTDPGRARQRRCSRASSRHRQARCSSIDRTSRTIRSPSGGCRSSCRARVHSGVPDATAERHEKPEGRQSCDDEPPRLKSER
jgi:hypothetical protein